MKNSLLLAKYYYARLAIIKAIKKIYPEDHDLGFAEILELLEANANAELIDFVAKNKLETITLHHILGDDFLKIIAKKQKKKPLAEIIDDIRTKYHEKSLARYKRYAKAQKKYNPPEEELKVVTDEQGNEYYLQPKTNCFQNGNS